jgi:hypothetical protein
LARVKSVLVLVAFAATAEFFCLPIAKQTFAAWGPPHLSVARQQLARFFDDTGPHTTGITRDGSATYGDPFAKGASGGPLLPVYQLELPRKVSAEGPIPGFVRWADRATGWLVIACAGTGCAYRVPIIYSEAMLDSVRLVMATAMGNVTAENAAQEAEGLEAAAVQMEHLLAAKLAALTPGELAAYRVKGASHDPWTQDCVDQAANGTSYSIVWAESQLMRFHRPYYPGFRSGLRPHFYSRLQRIGDGKVLALDLYHRNDGIGRGSPVFAMPDPNNGA